MTHREMSEGAREYGEPQDRQVYDDEWTSIIVKQQPTGRWLATQDGIPIEGTGACASEAVADFCEGLQHGPVV